MADQPSNTPETKFLPEIRRARVMTLNIYEVSDAELYVLERGSPDSLFLNFAVFLLSSAVTLTAALFSSEVRNETVNLIFIVFTVVAYLGGIFLGMFWFRSRKSVSKCVEEIKKRLPPEGVSESLKQSDGTLLPEPENP